MTNTQTGAGGIRDLVVEAVNARDLDLLSQESGVEMPSEVVDRLQQMIERRPRAMLTHGSLHGLPVAAVWMPDRNERYVTVGHLEVTVENGTVRLAVVPRSDPDLVSEAPAGRQVAEWETTDMIDSADEWWV